MDSYERHEFSDVYPHWVVNDMVDSKPSLTCGSTAGTVRQSCCTRARHAGARLGRSANPAVRGQDT